MNLHHHLTFCLALTVGAIPAAADTVVYAITSNQQFGTFDISTGSFNPVGPGTPEGDYGMVPGPNGSLLTLTYSGNLDAINPATGMVTSSLPTGLGNCTAPVPGQCGPNSANTIGELGGVIYATDYQNNLYTINPLTGAKTFVAATGVPAVPIVPFSTNPDGTLNFYGEALFGANGKLFATFFTGTLDPNTFQPTPVMSDHLYEIDPSTGATVNLDPDAPIAFGIDSVVDIDGVYYAFANASGEVDSLNLANATTTPIGSYDTGATGLIFGAVAVPEPMSFGLTLFAIAGFIALKRRKSASLARAALVIMISAVTANASNLNPACAAVIGDSRALMAQEHMADAETLLSNFLDHLNGDWVCRATVLVDRADALQHLGRSEEAQHSAEECVRLIERSQGTDAPLLRRPLLILAQLAFARQNFHQSATLLARADEFVGAPPTYLAASHGLKGCILFREGSLDAAATEFRESLEERAKAGEDKSSLATPELIHLAMLELKRGQPADALVETERASEILEHSPYSPELSIDVLVLSALARAGLHQNQEATRDFERAGEKIADLPPSLRAPVGRTVYQQHASFLRTTGHKPEAKKIARQETEMFGPDNSSLTVSADSLLKNPRK